MFSGFILPGDLTVSLIVFSGRPNPKWKILSTNPGYKEIVTMLQNAKNVKLTYRPVDMPARLGYKGFLVQNSMKKEADLIVGPKTANLQKLLLKTCQLAPYQKPNYRAFLKRSIKERSTPRCKPQNALHPTISLVRGMAYLID